MRANFLVAALLCGLLGPAGQPNRMTWEKPIAPGLVYREVVDPAAHLTINALRVSMKSPSVRMTTDLHGHAAYKQSEVTGRAPLSRIVSESNALAGVNGDFFSMQNEPSGDPLGIMVRDGRLVSTPSRRVAFGWGPDSVEIATPSFSGTVQSGSTVIRIDAVNRNCKDNEVTLDTPDAGLALAKAPSIAVELRLEGAVWSPSTVLRGTVASISADEGSKPVAPDRAVLEGRGQKGEALTTLKPGASVTLVVKTTGFDWDQIDSVIGGGPCLVKGGVVQIDAKDEGFGPEFSDRKHPRTAIGRTPAGDIWLVTVDGRQETGDGMTLAEMAKAMVDLDCTDAINLDGGGSTTMNVLGVTVNRPSDGQERPIADSVLVLGRQPASRGEGARLWVPDKMAVGTTARAYVAEASQKIPDLNVIWGCQGACAIDQGGNLRALHPGTAFVTACAKGRQLSGSFPVKATDQAKTSVGAKR